ncbi:DUF1579 domain-containing protein [Myxococcus sp. K38C18041901]|uniref:DUF1579 domain-containing protein n=1 Tax=Myxococcus guangdongensis TaxID=2906760 RepID=UPI0020A7C9DB|nr:DUF1579 domain-containing protein [Myxococcus guangdongensis]MCP3064781.1 DUF1579 domain-containing protein [Myxococcus guangdongensis]
MSQDWNATNAPTAEFEPSEHHQRLNRLVGTWEGPTQTWFDPTATPEESRTNARIEPLLGGRFVRVDYHSTAMGKPHAGQLILGFDKTEEHYTAAWVDSFHMSANMMISTGAPREDGHVSVLGGYTASMCDEQGVTQKQKWGWRTVIHQPDADTLVLQSFNIWPEGREDRAVETRLTRRRQA